MERPADHTGGYERAKHALRERLLANDGLFDVASTSLGLRTNMAKVVANDPLPFDMRLRDGTMEYRIPEEEARDAFESLPHDERAAIARTLLMRSARRLGAMELLFNDPDALRRARARRIAAILATTRFVVSEAENAGE